MAMRISPTTLKTAARWAALGLGGLVALVLVAFALLQTPPAKRLLADWAEGLLAGPGLTAELSTPEGVLPFSFRIARLRLKDGQGEWLSVSDAAVAVKPWPFGKGAASVDLDIALAEVDRLPVLPPPKAKPPASRPLSFLDGLSPIPVEAQAHAAVRELRLGAGLAGREMAGNADLLAVAEAGAVQAEMACSLDGGANARAKLSARFDPGVRFARVALDLDEGPGGLASALAGLPPDAPVKAALHGEGPFSDFQATLAAWSADTQVLDAKLQANLGRASADDHRFGLELAADPRFLPVSPELRQGLGDTAGLSFVGTLSSAGLPEPQWKLLIEKLTVTAKAASATMTGDTGPMGRAPRLAFTVSVADPGALHMKAGPVAVEGTVEADLDPDGPLDAHVRLASPDLLGALSPLGVGLGGKAMVDAAVKGDAAVPEYAATLEVALSEIAPGQGDLGPKLAAALGTEAALTAEASLDRDKLATLKQLHVTAMALKAEASGTYNLESRAADLRAELDSENLAPFSALAGARLAGALSAKVLAKGTPEAPEVSLEVQAEHLGIDQTRLDRAGLSLSARPEQGGVTGHLAADAVRDKGRLTVATGFALAGDTASLTSLRATGPGLDASADVTASLKHRTASGGLKASADLAQLGAFLNRKMAGRAQATATLSAAGENQKVTARVEATGIAAQGAKVAKADLAVSVDDAVRAPSGEATATVAGAATGEASVESLRLRAKGTGKEVGFEVSARGTYQGRFQADTAGAFAPKPGGGALKLAKLTATAKGVALALKRPATATFEPDGLVVEGLALAVDTGTVTASGSLKRSKADFAAQVAALPLGISEKLGYRPMTGTAGAALKVTGTAAAPRVTAGLKLENVRDKALADRNVPPMNAKADAEIAGGRLSATCSVSAGPEASFEARAALPAKLTLAPFAFVVARDAPLEAALKGGVDMARLAAFSGNEALRLRGVLKADFTATGRLNAPVLAGRATMDGGQLDYLDTGTRLRDLGLEVEASGTQVTLKRLSAHDQGGGSIQASGKAGLGPGSGYPFEGTLSANKFKPLRMDMVTGTVSAQVDVSGNASGAKVKGAAHVGPMEVNLPERLPPEAAPIQVQMVNAPGRPPPGQSQVTQVPPVPTAPFPAELDLGIDFPGRVFIRGMGLDSVWAGDLHVKGTAAKPVIDGAVRVVRGRLDFFGKNFELTKGEVTFSGSTPPMPMLDVEAQAKTADLTASILITGNAQRPAIDLVSEPPVPKDEILSRVLFGQSLSSLNPPQALQLAQALANLSGAGSSLDFLGKTRKLTGLDYLGVKSTGQGGVAESSLAAGKYISDRVYVEASQGLGSSSSSVSVEVNVTKNITVDSKVGLDSKTGAGINWKFDY